MKAGLLTLCFLFGLILAYEMTKSYEFSDTATASEPLELFLPKEQESRTTLSLQDFSEIIERPLFSDDRRPFVPQIIETELEPVPEAPPEAPPMPSDFDLSAIILSEGKQLALIKIEGGSKIEHLSLGAELNGWTLTDIRPKSVTLTQGDEHIRLELSALAKGRRGEEQHLEPAMQETDLAGDLADEGLNLPE